MKRFFQSGSTPSGRSKKACFILGSGRSMLELTGDELAHISASPFILAFNKYLIFYKKAGIIPTHYLLGDSGDKAVLMFNETIRMCHLDPLANVRFFFSIKLRERLLKDNPQSPISDPAISERSTLITRYGWLKGGKWARSLDEPIYHYRGSLSGAINITSILNPGARIKLLGVDLNDNKYFFEEEIEQNPDRWGLFAQRRVPDAPRHGTILEHKGTGGIQDVFPYMQKQVKKNGGEIQCCNPGSYLVTHGIVPYASVIGPD